MAVSQKILQPITGFPEFLPEERILELGFLDTIRTIFELYGFTPIETPAVERNETLESKGEINKQIYSLFRPNVPEEVDHETGLSLHFDLTVPLARYVAQNFGKLAFPFRRYQIQKVWRGERPQKGRFREFYQCDIDIVGDGPLDLLADAEIPMVINEIFARLNLGVFVIRMSNRKILQGLLNQHEIDGERAEETLRGIDRLPKLKGGWGELAPWLSSELDMGQEVLETLEFLLQKSETDTSTPLDRLQNLVVENETFQNGVRQLEGVVERLETLGLPKERLEIDLSITRGLDYYTGTVYETFLLEHEKTLGSVCSGGRYDNLARNFTDRILPGVGMSIGLSRLFSGLLDSGAIRPGASTPAEVMVTVPDRSRLSDALNAASLLRAAGLRVELYVQEAKHEKQLKTAVRKGIPFAVIPWPEKVDELDSMEVRNLVTGDREIVLRHETPSVIRFVLEKSEEG